MNDIHLAINEAVGSSTIGACLLLSGFESAADFHSFTEDTVRDIEKFVSNVCRTLPRRERSRYLDPIFIDRPDLFSFAPVVKSRLVSFVQRMISLGQLIDLSDLSSDARGRGAAGSEAGDCRGTEASASRPGIVIEEVESEGSIENDLSSVSPSVDPVGGHRMCETVKHEYVSDTLARKFDQCRLVMGEDFRLYESIDGSRTGYFMCRIDPATTTTTTTPRKHKTVFPISFTMRGYPNLSMVHNHMRTHFRLSSGENSSNNQLTNYEQNVPQKNKKEYFE